MRSSITFPKFSFFVLVICSVFISCDDGLPPDPFANNRDAIVVDASTGLTSVSLSIARTNFNNFPFEDLSDLEVSGIQFIREEEKVATDYLMVMADMYSNTALSALEEKERNHFLLAELPTLKYGLLDPTSGNASGKFTSPNLQAFYNRALDMGVSSEETALVGAAMLEEASLVTIDNQLEGVANNRDLRMVYHTLAAATRNHMRYLAREISDMGSIYIPMFISASDYQEIIGSPIEERSGED